MINADVAQLVEHDLAKVGVAGSSLVIRSTEEGLEDNMKLFGSPNPFYFSITKYARVVELVDTQDLKSCSHCGSAGSIPAPGTPSSVFSFQGQ